MAVEHDCLGVEQDLADVREDLRSAEESYDACLKLLEMTQTCFGDIVRGKEHDGGNLMSLIDRLLYEPDVKRRLKAFEAGERLAGRHADVRPLSYLDERAVKVLQEAHAALKYLLPFAHRSEHHQERAAGREASESIEAMLRQTGNW